MPPKPKTHARVFAEISAIVDQLFAHAGGVRPLMDDRRACCFATVAAANRPTKKNLARQRRCYRDLVARAAGRKPTEAELAHVLGAAELPKETA